MTPLHLMTIVGTRPEIIRLSAVIRCCDRYFRQTLVHTGQNWDYTLHGIFFQDLGLRPPDRQLHVAGSHLGQTLGNVLSQSYQLLQELRPDAVLLLGDTNSCLSAISAKRLQIPIFHMEAGNRCFDSRVPEEINRRIVDVTADYHLFHTKIGVKLCSMAGGGVSRNLWNFFRTAPAGTGQAVTCSTSGMGLRLK